MLTPWSRPVRRDGLRHADRLRALLQPRDLRAGGAGARRGVAAFLRVLLGDDAGGCDAVAAAAAVRAGGRARPRARAESTRRSTR